MENVINSAKIQAEKGHKVLVVSDRVEMLELCSSFLDNSMVVTGETEDRDFIKSKKDILFGASKIYSEGVNIPELSCLILAMTTNNVGLLEQLLGRISRNHPGKKNPEVIDFALVGQTAKRHLQTRVGFYIEKKYKIKYV
jgi:superfamily II DNA or RNA helicase